VVFQLTMAEVPKKPCRTSLAGKISSRWFPPAVAIQMAPGYFTRHWHSMEHFYHDKAAQHKLKAKHFPVQPHATAGTASRT